MKNLKIGFNFIPLTAFLGGDIHYDHTSDDKKYGKSCFGVIKVQCEVAQSPENREFEEGDFVKVNASIEGIKFFEKKKSLTSKELRAIIYLLHDLADVDHVQLSAEDASILNEV